MWVQAIFAGLLLGILGWLAGWVCLSCADIGRRLNAVEVDVRENEEGRLMHCEMVDEVIILGHILFSSTSFVATHTLVSDIPIPTSLSLSLSALCDHRHRSSKPFTQIGLLPLDCVPSRPYS